MDEQPGTKEKRSLTFRIIQWTAISVVLLAVLILGAATVYGQLNDSEHRATAALPVRERNLKIFDAACDLLHEHYYDPAMFDTEAWHKYHDFWREQAAHSQPGIYLYLNVLANFGKGLSGSHVHFDPPDSLPAPEAEKVAAATPTSAPANPPKSPVLITPEMERKIRHNGEVWNSDPGFEWTQIRRRNLLVGVITSVRRGSVADSLDIAPGWGLVADGKDVGPGGVRYHATLLELSAVAARELERTARPPGAASASPSDPYVIEHGIKFNFEPDVSPKIPPFETRKLPGGATYLRFDTFADSDIVAQAYDTMDEAGPDGLVIDLRRNPGGRRWYLERFLGRLLGNRAAIGSFRDHGSTDSMRTWHIGGVYQGPLIMLIGPQSQSASEIAASVIQDTRRGKLIGRFTNGSVLKGKLHSLPDGGTMMVPESDYLRVNGKPIEGVGVEPDVWVMPTLADIRAGRDPALEKAEELLGH